MFSWFNARDAQKFGATLADFFIERVPVDPSNKKVKSLEKKQEVLSKMFAQIEIYKINNHLNLYKKAKLGNAFKWRLLDAHYPEDFVDEMTKALLVKF